MSDIGEYNLILEGLKECQDILKSKNKLDGKRPQSSLECTFWKSVGSCAGGKVDPNNSVKEQTDGKGMNCMQHITKITHALLSM